MKDGVCGHHENMLEKSEFRWVFGICFSALGALGLVMWNNSASVDQVKAIDEKVEYRDHGAERRTQRLEKMIEKLSSKVDKIDGYLRVETSGARYN